VFRSHNPGKRAVCVKLLPPEVQHDLTELGRVREMFQKVHALQHQHLCPVYLLGSDPLCGEFLVMKYIDGQTLSEYRRSYVEQHGEFPLTEVVRVLTPVAEALDYVHSQGLIHRDVKPANIMVSRDGQTVQVVDLGLAAEIQGSMNRVSKGARDIAGTAPYMAPEQLNGDPLDGKCDQYALPRNVVRGRRCFLAEKFGPIPQDDLDLSSDEFEKRLV
jgi:serine/threonine protein kinase